MQSLSDLLWGENPINPEEEISTQSSSAMYNKCMIAMCDVIVGPVGSDKGNTAYGTAFTEYWGIGSGC